MTEEKITMLSQELDAELRDNIGYEPWDETAQEASIMVGWGGRTLVDKTVSNRTLGSHSMATPRIHI